MIKAIETVITPYSERVHATLAHEQRRFAATLRELRGKAAQPLQLREPAFDRSNRRV